MHEMQRGETGLGVKPKPKGPAIDALAKDFPSPSRLPLVEF
jgi:hypothetical protein